MIIYANDQFLEQIGRSQDQVQMTIVDGIKSSRINSPFDQSSLSSYLFVVPNLRSSLTDIGRRFPKLLHALAQIAMLRQLQVGVIGEDGGRIFLSHSEHFTVVQQRGEA